MKGNQENAKNKNMSIKLVGRGGGLAGIILLGGALAALVTTFAFKRKPHSNSNKSTVGEGLSFLVPDSPSNGTKHTQDGDGVSTQLLLDESSETNVGNYEEMDISRKERNNCVRDESSIINREEFPVLVADSSLPLKLEEVKNKNDSLEEVEVTIVDEKFMTTDCNQVGDPYIVRQVPVGIAENNQQLVKTAADTNDQLGLDGKAHEQGGECDGNGNTMTERKEILVEGAHSNQPGTDNDSPKIHDENGEIILEKRKEPVEAAVIDQMPHMGEEICGNDTEKRQVLIGEGGINFSEELEATAMYGDQDILCSDGTVLVTNEICHIKKPELLPQIDSSSVNKPANNDRFEDHLVDDTKIVNGDEANEAADQEDQSKVEDSEQSQLVEANGDNKGYYNTYRENTKDKLEEADEISVLNDQQMQLPDECQKIHINGDQKKYNSAKSLPDINSFPSNGFGVQEFSFPSLDSLSLAKPGNLHKYDAAETTLQAEAINPLEKDGLAEEVIAYQIILENNPSVQSAGNDGTQIYDDGGDTTAAKGEETQKTSFVDIAQPTTLSEEVDNNNDSKEDEKAVEMIQRENFEVESHLQVPQNDHDYNVDVDREEYDNNCDVEDDNDEEDIDNDTEEEDDVEEVEISSETTGDSSLDSNAEAIWPDESVLQVKDMQAHNQNFKEDNMFVKFNSHKLDDDDRDSSVMAHGDKLSADTTTLEHTTNIFNLKFWFLSLLVSLLLLLWFSCSHRYFTSFHYHLE